MRVLDAKMMKKTPFLDHQTFGDVLRYDEGGGRTRRSGKKTILFFLQFGLGTYGASQCGARVTFTPNPALFILTYVTYF